MIEKENVKALTRISEESDTKEILANNHRGMGIVKHLSENTEEAGTTVGPPPHDWRDH